MKHFDYDSVTPEQVSDYDSKGTTIRRFIKPDEAPHFIMRRFELEPGGKIGVHSHDAEHEIYVLKGELNLIDESGNKSRVKKDEFIYVPPNEPHGYSNESYDVAAFICVVPK